MSADADAPFDDAAIEAARKLFARECRFVAGADRPEAMPPDDLVEVAFAGRSNVGKSSLINALTGRNALARTSRTPGRTQQLNFFALDDALMLVDLPGYGYARASKSKIGAWTALMFDYLKGRPNLRRLFLLIDSRHGLKDADRALMDELDAAAVVYQAVLTKTDKLTPGALAAARRDLGEALASHAAAHPRVIATSAQTGDGIALLRAELGALVAENQFG